MGTGDGSLLVGNWDWAPVARPVAAQGLSLWLHCDALASRVSGLSATCGRGRVSQPLALSGTVASRAHLASL